jgi:hypothetical protein
MMKTASTTLPASGFRLPLLLTQLFLVTALTSNLNVVTAGGAPDYEMFDEMLLQNVRNGFVDYDGFNADSRFPEFITRIGESAPVALETQEDKLAFFVNAYNALAIKGILDGHSPATFWGRYRFFNRQKYFLLGKKINLENLERDRIMPLGDPRIHFAIVCASLSCPRLSSRAYQPNTVDLQLHDSAMRFINDPTRNRFDLDRRIAFISMIFKWYAEDFERAGGTLQQYLARFVAEAEVQDALRLDQFELRYVEYDWHLNGLFSGAD